MISDELLLDGNARQNLATFCQTWEEPEVHKLMDLAIDKNMIDKDEYPQTAEIERRCVHMLADLWNAPDAGNTVGCSAIGSSEACMLGGMAAKWRWRAKRAAEGKPDRQAQHGLRAGPGGLAQVRPVLGRRDPRGPDGARAATAWTPRRCSSGSTRTPSWWCRPSGSPTPGPTSRCSSSPRPSTSCQERDRARHRHPRRRGQRGPSWPRSARPTCVWDFRVPRVKSISTSGHKFGLAPLGVGWVLWRDAAELPDDLIFHVTYLGGDMPVFQINFSRPAGQIVAQYYDFIRLGREGYRHVHMACYETGQCLAKRDRPARPLRAALRRRPRRRGSRRWPGASREGEDPGYTLYDLADRLRVRGWQVPAYPLTGTVADIAVQRILVRQGVSRDMAALLMDDFEDGHRPLHQAPGHRVDDQGGVGRLQPPLSRRRPRAAGAEPGVGNGVPEPACRNGVSEPACRDLRGEHARARARPRAHLDGGARPPRRRGARSPAACWPATPTRASARCW